MNEGLEAVRAKIGRRLDVHDRPEDEAGGRDRPDLLLERGLGRAGHPGAGLGAEILDDHFLDVPVALVEIADGEQRLDALEARLADADQDSRGEGHAGATSGVDRRKPRRGMLVGGAEMRAATPRKPLGSRFQHDALRCRNAAQPPYPSLVHEAGVEMRQQSRLFEDDRGRSFEVAECRLVTELSERLARRRIATLGLVAERKKGLLDPMLHPSPRDVENRLGGQIGGFSASRRMGEGAVMTDIRAKLRERDENFLRKGDVVAVACEAKPLGDRRHAVGLHAARERERLFAIENFAVLGRVERLAGVDAAHHASLTPIGAAGTVFIIIRGDVLRRIS